MVDDGDEDEDDGEEAFHFFVDQHTKTLLSALDLESKVDCKVNLGNNGPWTLEKVTTFIAHVRVCWPVIERDS